MIIFWYNLVNRCYLEANDTIFNCYKGGWLFLLVCSYMSLSHRFYLEKIAPAVFKIIDKNVLGVGVGYCFRRYFNILGLVYRIYFIWLIDTISGVLGVGPNFVNIICIAQLSNNRLMAARWSGDTCSIEKIENNKKKFEEHGKL